MKFENFKIGIIGLGYVGLPLAVEFGKKFKTIGFDINKKRVDELKSGLDV
ncbi:TPA: Vi polysaccharide biosynthesis UDP-N-acetylglucosamine C-6 dehydrogenase TviB, partial [Vibrio cholerae]|nr:Vi polysaccharide biosynthesis UDP-N-acetylglucosamine C-6 dehydrogenase TviB [Vibrio cholerae]